MIEKREYIATELEEKLSSPEMIISRSLDDEIKNRMIAVIETEAPIREELLFKRVINSLGLVKLGSRLSEVFLDIASTLEYETSAENCKLVYHKDVKNENYFRPTPDSIIRYSYQIPFSEGANCILYILENSSSSSYTKSALRKLFLKEMNYQKCGAKVDELYKFALLDPRIKISGNGRILK